MPQESTIPSARYDDDAPQAKPTVYSSNSFGDEIVELPEYKVQAKGISDFGMSIRTNPGVLWGGSVGRMRVGEVVPDSAAAMAGLKRGQWILEVDGAPVAELRRGSMLRKFFRREVGDRITLKVSDYGGKNPYIVELAVNPKRIER